MYGAVQGSSDAFLRKFDSNGNLLFSKQFGVGGMNSGDWIAVDSSGSIFIGGTTTSSLAGNNMGLEDVFMRKYDNIGTEIFSIQFGTNGTDNVQSCRLDSVGNVYLTGSTNGSLPGNSNSGDFDAMLIKFTNAGSLVFMKQLGTPAFDEFSASIINSRDEIFAVGSTMGSYTIQNAGGTDIITNKFDSNGTVLWSQQYGSSASSIDISYDGALIVCGTTSGNFPGSVNRGSFDTLLLISKEVSPTATPTALPTIIPTAPPTLQPTKYKNARHSHEPLDGSAVVALYVCFLGLLPLFIIIIFIYSVVKNSNPSDKFVKIFGLTISKWL